MTPTAELLIRATSRAFYTDDVIAIIDVLIRDKYLRDDDMGPRLKLSTKNVRSVLQFLKSEQLVFSENGE
jgi:transcription initiation factor TFIIE subunit alpha